MTFQRPELLVLAPLLALLLALALGLHWRRLLRLRAAYADPAMRRLFPLRLDRFPTTRLWCLVGAGAAIGLAAAGPLWVIVDPPEPPPPLDVAIAVDLSLSMSANDTPPSRLGRARGVVARLAEELPSVRFSVVVFAGWPYTLVPPTDDPEVVRYFAESMHVDIVGEVDRGNSLSAALATARSTLAVRPSEGGRQAVLLLSDGDVYEDERSILAAAAASAAEGIQVWVGGLGTESGATLLAEGAPMVDTQGRPVVSARATSLLRAIADAGAGRYEDASDEGGLEALVGELSALSGDDRADLPEPIDATFLMTLLAVPLLLWDSFTDSGRKWRRRPTAGREDGS